MNMVLYVTYTANIIVARTLRAFAHTPAKPEPSPTPALDAM
jgi:hypothetical protein